MVLFPTEMLLRTSQTNGKIIEHLNSINYCTGHHALVHSKTRLDTVWLVLPPRKKITFISTFLLWWSLLVEVQYGNWHASTQWSAINNAQVHKCKQNYNISNIANDSGNKNVFLPIIKDKSKVRINIAGPKHLLIWGS